MVPTDLGIVLAQGYMRIDPELVLPEVRARIERDINEIAEGRASKDDVIKQTLQAFKDKFNYFVQCVERMDALFEASFSPLSSSGKPFTKCGKTNRYMKLIPTRPARLYNPLTEEIYNLPQGGVVKQYKVQQVIVMS